MLYVISKQIMQSSSSEVFVDTKTYRRWDLESRRSSIIVNKVAWSWAVFLSFFFYSWKTPTWSGHNPEDPHSDCIFYYFKLPNWTKNFLFHFFFLVKDKKEFIFLDTHELYDYFNVLLLLLLWQSLIQKYVQKKAAKHNFMHFYQSETQICNLNLLYILTEPFIIFSKKKTSTFQRGRGSVSIQFILPEPAG